MPSLEHEAPLELLRGDPQLASVLLEGLGVPVPPGASARLVPADLTASLPAEMRADAVILLLAKDTDGGQANDHGSLAVVTEVQLTYDEQKVFTWPAYVTQARAAHRCDTVLMVICPDPATARQCRATITTGHPGFDLTPLVIDARTVPRPGPPGSGTAGPELAVLAVLTGALDLDTDPARRLVLASLASLHDERLPTYTVLVRHAASEAARHALEALMTTAPYRDAFVDGLMAEGKAEGLAEGKAAGEARMVLRVLSARGLHVTDEIRELVLSCSDTAQLEAWGERAATASNLDEVFGS
jgi:hypothetical protein